MLHTIKYSFLRLLRNKEEIFWILCFPIILAIFFKAGFSGINDSEKISPIPVGIVSENKENFESFKKVAESLEENNDTQLLKIQYISKEKAYELLKSNKIDGILTVKDKVTVTVSAGMSDKAINQSILNSIVKQYNTSKNAFLEVAAKHPEKLTSMISNTSEIQSKEISLTDRKNSDTFTQYFYNLLAMACLFTSMAGMRISIDNQGNLSLLGSRRCISPTNKLISVIGELISFTGFNFICNFIAYLFIVIVLKIDLTPHFPLAVLTLFISTLTGISFGFFVGAFSSASENIKNAICMSLSMLFCFMSGLMIGNMKIVVEKIFPVFNKINPAVLISDSFYSLSVYNTFERYCQNIITLVIMITAFTIGGFLLTRRKKYASL